MDTTSCGERDVFLLPKAIKIGPCPHQHHENFILHIKEYEAWSCLPAFYLLGLRNRLNIGCLKVLMLQWKYDWCIYTYRISGLCTLSCPRISSVVWGESILRSTVKWAVLMVLAWSTAGIQLLRGEQSGPCWSFQDVISVLASCGRFEISLSLYCKEMKGLGASFPIAPTSPASETHSQQCAGDPRLSGIWQTISAAVNLLCARNTAKHALHILQSGTKFCFRRSKSV